MDGGAPAMVSVNIPDATDSVTLWRRSQGETYKTRGAVARPLGGLSGVLDMEAGFDVDSTFELECFVGESSLGRVPLGRAMLPWSGDRNGVLIQNPFNPALSVTAVNLSGSWPSLTRESGGESVRIEGARRPRLVGASPMGGATAVPIDFGVSSRAAADALWATLGTEDNPQLPVWLIRTHQGILPRVFFARVESLTEVDINYRSGREWSRFQAVVTEIAPPAPGLVAPTLRYSDLAAVFPTYSEMAAALPRYSDWSTAWQYAGAAGGGGA